MKKRSILLIVMALCLAAGLSAQATTSGAVNGMTLNGATGLITVPDARVGWENADIGLDLGYGIVWTGGQSVDHLPRFALSLFRRFEVSGLLQVSTDTIYNGVIGAKFQIFKDGGAALAVGGDFEVSNDNVFGTNSDSAKVYLSATYGGDFFNMPAVTTATIGWQLLNSGTIPSTQFIYGMGFSMGLFPKAFKDYVFWIVDFSNFSYVVRGAAVNAGNRGAFNTGVRIHPIKDGRFNLVIDVVGTDLLDTSRGLAASVSGGLSF